MQKNVAFLPRVQPRAKLSELPKDEEQIIELHVLVVAATSQR